MRYTVVIMAALIALSAYGQSPAEQDTRPNYFMFVQTASSGSFKQIEGSTRSYELVLDGVTPTTIYLSDRPARLTGHVPMQKFIEGLGFDDDNPPNAAIEVQKEDGGTGVVVAELRKPDWNEKTRRLTYQIEILDDATDGGLAHYDENKKMTLPANFEGAALFIDDCPDQIVYCFQDIYEVDTIMPGIMKGTTPPCGSLPRKRGTCWNWSTAACRLCNNPTQECSSVTNCPHFGTDEDGSHPDEVVD